MKLIPLKLIPLLPLLLLTGCEASDNYYCKIYCNFVGNPNTIRCISSGSCLPFSEIDYDKAISITCESLQGYSYSHEHYCVTYKK